MDRHLTGRWGEEKAAAFLRRKGYKIIGMNYSCRMGEIDVIARNRKFIVFAEVKLRKSAAFAALFMMFLFLDDERHEHHRFVGAVLNAVALAVGGGGDVAGTEGQLRAVVIGSGLALQHEVELRLMLVGVVADGAAGV